MRHNDQDGSSLWARLNLLFSDVADRTILYQRGSLILVSYGALVTAGALLWMIVTGACLLETGLTHGRIAFFMIGAALSALLGAHLFWWQEHLPSMLNQPLLGLRHVGFVSWGGLLGTLVFSTGFSAATGYSLLATTDAVMRGLFGGYAVGRVGCLTYGCCYGRTARRFGVRYRNPAAKVVRERGGCLSPRYPTPVYSAAVGTALFVILNAMPYYHVRAGLITAVACLLYPIGRAGVECFRDRRRYIRSLFTGGHLACLVMFLAGCVLLSVLDPPNGAPGPLPLSLNGIRRSLTSAPGMLVAGCIVFLRTSVHWKRVGTW